MYFSITSDSHSSRRFSFPLAGADIDLFFFSTEDLSVDMVSDILLLVTTLTKGAGGCKIITQIYQLLHIYTLSPLIIILTDQFLHLHRITFFYHTNNQPLQIHFIYFLGIHETFHTLTLQIRLNYVFKSYLINSMPISCLAEFFRHSVQVVHM